jgi:hypothetical protein
MKRDFGKNLNAKPNKLGKISQVDKAQLVEISKEHFKYGDHVDNNICSQVISLNQERVWSQTSK